MVGYIARKIHFVGYDDHGHVLGGKVADYLQDFAGQLRLNMASETVKTEVTVKTFVDGDTTHFHVPSSVAEDGVLQRWQAGTQTNAVMFKTTEKREERAWDFLRWWLSTDTQYLFADSMENYYGEEFRWFSANLDVVSMQAWPEDHKQVLLDQLSWYKQLPMVPGGSYMTSRELWNAWNRIVLDRGNYREEIEVTVEDIELEIGIKQRELGYIDEKGNILIPMDLMTIERPQGKEE